MLTLPNPSNWIEKEETMNKLFPLSQEYIQFWKMIAKRSIEGYWCNGVWIPPLTYSYCNLGHIKIQLQDGGAEKIIRPYPRDIDFEKGWIDVEAMGFVGFSNDTQFSGDPILLETNSPAISIYPHCYHNGIVKTYKPARDILRNTTCDLGNALYKANAKNVLDLESRGGGKSFWIAWAAIHTTHFDGAVSYDEWFKLKSTSDKLNAQVLISSIDAKYSSDLLQKVKLGMDYLPGKREVGNKLYPSPFSRMYTGSLDKEIVFEQKVQVGKNWVTKGSGSKLTHRTFYRSATAANGTRPKRAIIEEVGFCSNLTDVLAALETCVAPNNIRFGSVWMCGTGGLNDLAGIQQLSEVFYNPERYNCLAFPDLWENTGKICYFVPQIKTMMKYYEPEKMQVNAELAENAVRKELQRLVDSKASKRDIDLFKTNQPLKPSDALMSVQGDKFPTEELKEHLAFLRTEEGKKLEGTEGFFVSDERGNIKFEVGGRALKFKAPAGSDKDGAVVIWEQPFKNNSGVIPSGLYIAGHDGYDQDQSTTDSLGSTFIMKRFYPGAGRTDVIVAEYTARPEKRDKHHEQVRRMIAYYNAVLLHENDRNSILDHFEAKFSLHLMAKTPNFLKATERTKVNRGYGQHMILPVKLELEKYLYDWLLDTVEGVPNYKMIKSIPLIEELINYNHIGNFDRVDALLMTINYLLSLRTTPVKVKKALKVESWFKHRHFV